MCKLFAFLFITSGLTIYSYGFAAPDKVQYELQERCGKQSAETFKREWGTGTTNGKDGQGFQNYKNHYNAKLNKCFYMVTGGFISKEKTQGTQDWKRLLDVHENKEYATYIKNSKDKEPMACSVLDKQCSSAKEWEVLIKPYMED